MSDVDDLRALIPLDQLTNLTGASAEQVQQVLNMVLPALVSGLQANAQDPAAAASLHQALGQHSPTLVEGAIDLSAIDLADGEAITRHVFGANTDAVVAQLGGSSDNPLVGKLLAVIAPIVLSYLARQLGSGDHGALGDILSEVLKGASQGSSTAGSSGGIGGDILGDLLGGLLGGGRR